MAYNALKSIDLTNFVNRCTGTEALYRQYSPYGE